MEAITLHIGLDVHKDSTADVGKDDLHLHTQIPLSQGADKVVELHIANRNRPIQAALAQYAQLAQEHRLEQLRLLSK